MAYSTPHFPFSLFLLLGVSLVSCSLISCSSTTPDFTQKKNPTQKELARQIPPHLRSKGADQLSETFSTEESQEGSSLPTNSFGEVETAPPDGSIPGLLPPLPEAGDLVWTDPDNPLQDLGSVEDVFTEPVKDPWQLSFQAALRLSFVEGKPLMIWFTDSRTSPICKILGRELFGTPGFETWSEKNLIKLRVDLNPPEKDRKLRQQKKAYAVALRKKFRVNGNPTVIMIGNSGETLGRYKGYTRGEANYYWGRIKQVVSVYNNDYYDWRDGMDQKGYRLWQGRNGVKLFAKLLKYQEGTLLIVEPNGRKTRIAEANLSSGDQRWIQKEKEKRGL